MIYKMLKGRNFRNFFISDVTQGFGVGMSTIGANWFLLDQTGSATAVGLLLAINVIAGFLVFPLVGTLTDKFNRKAIIMWTHLTRSLLIFILTALFFINGFHTIYLYIFTVINGIGWTIYMSASRSLIQEILTKDEYVNGNSLIEISLQVGMFMAGGVSGLLYKYFGFEIILLMNSIAFIVSSIALIRITYKSDIVTENNESFLKNFKGGLSYLNNQKLLFIFGVVSIIPLVSTMIFNVVVPSYVSDSLHAGSVVFGITDMFYGVGGLVSGFLAAPLAKRLSSKYAIFLFFIMAIIIMTILT
ncbi:MFS transporter, partial [Priestia filamentosa]|uniref:MFS transporter n=1 Tax=Priestia filamentosa TaxID=1402861 RepID=UPI0039822D15